MTPEERADALVAVESVSNGFGFEYHNVTLGGTLRLMTIFTSINSLTPREAAERQREAVAVVIADAIRAAVLAEREACARACEAMAKETTHIEVEVTCELAADAIRERAEP